MSTTPRRSVWILVSAGSAPLDVVGPFDVLRRVNAYTERHGYDITLVSASDRVVPTRGELGFVAQRTLAEATADGTPHTVLVGGGDPETPRGSDEERFAEWLRENGPRIARIGSVCSGAFVLGEAGLLDGRRATTHWGLIGTLQERFPQARVVDDALFVTDGGVWTSAGVSAGIDMTLDLVEEDFGYEVSLAVARFLVLFLRRSGNQRQFSAPLSGQLAERRSLRELQAFISANLGEDLSIERLARVCNMSPRNFSRVFKGELGCSPARFVRRVRLEEARRLLESTELGVSEIATRAGAEDEGTLRRWFVEYYGVSPGEYRQRFRASRCPSPAG